MQSDSAALLVLDAQIDFLTESGRLPIARDQLSSVLRALNEAIEAAETQNIAIILFRNSYPVWNWQNPLRNFAALQGSEGEKLHPELVVPRSAVHMVKQRRDAFSNGDLDIFLKCRTTREIIVAGVFAEACVVATALAGQRRGYATTVLQSAVGGRTAVGVERTLVYLGRRGILSRPSLSEYSIRAL